MRQILVTGGAGYIGAHTAVELHKAGYRTIIVDDFSNSEPSVICGLTELTGSRPLIEQVNCLDLSALDAVFQKYGPIEAVIHFAAFKDANASIQKPLSYYRNNVGSLLNLLDSMRRHACRNMVFSSSCVVYGQPRKLPVDESAPFQKMYTPYGVTKQICEKILHDVVTTADGSPLRAVSLRYFNAVGAHPSALIGELSRGLSRNLIPLLTRTAAGLRPKLQVFGNDYNTPDGSCIRDYIYIEDLAKAHLAALDYLSDSGNPDYDYFNIGTGRGFSVFEIIKAFEKATGIKLPYEIVGRRPGDIEQIWADSAKANKLLGWKASTPLEDIMRSAWKWQQRICKQ